MDETNDDSQTNPKDSESNNQSWIEILQTSRPAFGTLLDAVRIINNDDERDIYDYAIEVTFHDSYDAFGDEDTYAQTLRPSYETISAAKITSGGGQLVLEPLPDGTIGFTDQQYGRGPVPVIEAHLTHKHRGDVIDIPNRERGTDFPVEPTDPSTKPIVVNRSEWKDGDDPKFQKPDHDPHGESCVRAAHPRKQTQAFSSNESVDREPSCGGDA